MQRVGWIGLVALVGLGVWWMATSRQPDRADAGVGAVESSRAQANAGDDTGAQPPKPSSTTPTSAGSLVRAGAAGPERSADRLSAGASEGTASTTDGSSPQPARSISAATGSDSDAATRRPTGQGEAADIVPGAPSVSQAGRDSQATAPGRSLSGRDDPAVPDQSAAGDPIADEVVIDYLARRSLGEDPTPEQLNERRGWAATLLSGESQEVRNELKVRADEAAALE